MYLTLVALFASVASAIPAPDPTPVAGSPLLNQLLERQIGGGIPGIAGASLIGDQ